MAKIFGVLTLIVTGGIVADIWAHPDGTKAAASGFASFWTPSLRAVTGQAVS